MRKIFDFHGGIHPPENKQQSLRGAIRDAGIPPELVLPLSQHIGAPASPVVAVGDRVLAGQLIAEAPGFVSAPLHAPTSGTVTAIEERLIAHPSGLQAPCIVIATDGLDEWTAQRPVGDAYHNMQAGELLALIRNAGIAGMGGAGFPTAVKLATRPDSKVQTLIINGTECEPYITADDILMRERPGRIIEGVNILRHLLAPTETLIGVEDNKPEAIAALRAAAAGSAIEIVSFPTKYPSGGEKQLIEILTGKQVPSGGLPMDVGVICQNVGTVVAIQDAVLFGRPLVSRITTVTGEAVDKPGNYEVLLGTSMSYLLAQAGYRPQRGQRLVMGGPMMGFSVPDTNVPIVKTTNCLLAPGVDELPAPPPPQACIRCGMCAEVCPASLLPQQLFWFAQGKEFEKLEQHNLFDCIECGACSWVCPSNIPLVQYYRASKAEILQLRREHAKAEQSRLRFEARQERIAREEAAREARRAARKQAAEQRAQAAAAGGAGDEDPIQAAIDRAKAKKAAQQAGAGDAPGERDKLEKAVLTTRARLATATAKLQQARDEGSDLVDALQLGVDKTRAKLEAAERALQDLAGADSTSAAASSPADPAAAAIARALAARETDASLSPADKARSQLQGLEQRLEKTRNRLATCRANGDEEKIIEALESTVLRLEEKVNDAREQLTANGDA
ncbi:MAG: electron transport complex subunit RsxC [Halieaceae bacterium]|jgi:electron transport complex protein RnfC|nr:electron transport complex subunit RsxC [Halieaceae bacterium]